MFAVNIARRSLSAVVDLILPRACADCSTLLSADDDLFCADCALKISHDAVNDYCPRCGCTAEPFLVSAEGCPECRHHRTTLDGLARVGTYGGSVGALVRRFKFNRQQRLDLPLGTLLAASMRARVPIEEIHALVPVPADWWTWWRYRCHPAHMIARVAGRRLRVPVRALVRVTRKLRRQAALPAAERIRNVRGAFRTARGARLQGASLCVIDDVATTGATLREMGRVLKDAGAARVFAAIVAKTQLGVDDFRTL